MKKKWKVAILAFFSIVVVLVASIALLRMNTKKHSPVDKIAYTDQGLDLKIVYCQPFRKGRLIFGTEEAGALQPWGNYWRLGANEATTIELASDLTFGGKPLKAGKYSIYAVPGEKTWKIGVNKGANRWGYSEPDYDKDVLNVEVPVTYSDEVVEMFTMSFEPAEEGVELVMKWDTSVIKVPIK